MTSIHLTAISFSLFLILDPVFSMVGAETSAHEKYFFPQGYVGGSQLREQHSDIVISEKGFTVEVPLTYERPELGNLNVYVHPGLSDRPFDSTKPTIFIVDGGPGQSSHKSTDNEIYSKINANVIRFDQRGIAFSRFNSFDQALNADYYSSEFIAQDIAKIMDHLKIPEATIWGASYGTVPATIFGHLFPDRTKALILEGVLYNGYDGDPKSTPLTLYQLNRVYKELPSAVREKISLAVERGWLDPQVFPDLIFDVLGLRGRLQLGRFLNSELIKKINDTSIENLSQLLTNTGARAIPNPAPSLPTREALVRPILTIKEFAARSNDAVFSYKISGDRIVIDNSSSGKPRYAIDEEFYSFVKPSALPYSAGRYPVNSPVFYLQGAIDLLTPPNEAITHFKNVPKSAASLYIFTDAGHAISPAITNAGTESDRKLFNQFLEDIAATGETKVNLSRISFTSVATTIRSHKLWCSKFYEQ